MPKIKVITNGIHKEIDADLGANLYQELINAGINVNALCGGHGTCGKCKVKLIEGELDEPNGQEKKKLGNLLEQNIRLSCLCKISSDITISPITADDGAQIMADGGDVDLFDDEEGFGLAVDIGTTTVAAFLMELKTGKKIATKSGLNAQRPYGADVIARSGYTIENVNGLEKLSNIIRNQISQMAKELCEEACISCNQIIRVTLAGNPTMMHIAAMMPTNTIAVAPYKSLYNDGFDKTAEEAGLAINKNAIVRYLPCISGYVGADTVAATMSAGMDEDDKLCLLLDIGTNGEIVLGNKDKLYTCAAAAGPAFEGGKIACGIGGVLGAVDKFFPDGTFTTIGGKKARGICGSGLIDVIAKLYECDAIDETGVLDDRFCKNDYIKSRIISQEGQKAYLIISQAEGAEKDIYVCQKDIREVQLAKSAIAAGVAIVILRYGIKESDIEKVYLAGGFGTYIDYNSACTIGLLPRNLRDRIKSIGNAAGTGARQAVCSEEMREKSQKIGRMLNYIELAEDKAFPDEFMDNMMFPE